MIRLIECTVFHMVYRPLVRLHHRLLDYAEGEG